MASNEIPFTADMVEEIVTRHRREAYLAGFRAAREAAAKECDAVARDLHRNDACRIGYGAMAETCARFVRAIPDPQPGTAGDAKDTK